MEYDKILTLTHDELTALAQQEQNSSALWFDMLNAQLTAMLIYFKMCTDNLYSTQESRARVVREIEETILRLDTAKSAYDNGNLTQSADDFKTAFKCLGKYIFDMWD